MELPEVAFLLSMMVRHSNGVENPHAVTGYDKLEPDTCFSLAQVSRTLSLTDLLPATQGDSVKALTQHS